MNKIKIILGVSLATAFIFFLGGLVYVNQLPEPDKKELVFVTLGIDQNKLPNESSSYEIQRATEHFSDVVLGWTIEPSFETEVEAITGYDVDITGRRQEKQNLLFTVSADPTEFDGEGGSAFLNVLGSRLAEHNGVTNAGYVIALSRMSLLTEETSSSRFLLGLTLLGFLLGASLLTLGDYARQTRR
ncbi:MAG: hypothetical protein AAB802_02965 [Patescibacteria group bacterium]